MDRNTLLVAFGLALRQARTAKGISQEELADLAGLHRTYIGSVERGERNPTLVSLYRIAEALDIPAAALLPPSGTVAPPPS